MSKHLATVLMVVLLATGCDSDEHQRTPEPTSKVSVPNQDPRKGKVQLDRVCGFWSCQEASMLCLGSTLILTPADGSTPVRVPDAAECRP